MPPGRAWRIGILTAYPPASFENTVAVIEDEGHIADVIEWKRIVPSIIDDSLTLSYDGTLEAGGLTDYDLLFNHFCGLRASYYYFALEATCATHVVNDWNAVVCAGDKMKTLIAARNLGIRVPASVLLGNANFDTGIAHAERHLRYPFIMKEVSSDNGDKVYLVKTRREAWQRWNESADDDLFLLQEYIQGENLRVVVLGDRVLYTVKNLIARGDFRANSRYHSGIERFTLPAADQGLMVDVARALELDFVGFDVIRRDGELWLMEANARPGTRCDCDLLEDDGFDLYREIGVFLLETAKCLNPQGPEKGRE